MPGWQRVPRAWHVYFGRFQHRAPHQLQVLLYRGAPLGLDCSCGSGKGTNAAVFVLSQPLHGHGTGETLCCPQSPSMGQPWAALPVKLIPRPKAPMLMPSWCLEARTLSRACRVGVLRGSRHPLPNPRVSPAQPRPTTGWVCGTLDSGSMRSALIDSQCTQTQDPAGHPGPCHTAFPLFLGSDGHTVGWGGVWKTKPCPGQNSRLCDLGKIIQPL